METITLRTPDILNIDGHLGFNQAWYTTTWQRSAGCGPTACAALLWYLSHTRPSCAGLTAAHGLGRAGVLSLMEAVWRDLTPGMMGVNTTEIFCGGALHYGEDTGIPLGCRKLQIPPRHPGRYAENALPFIEHCLTDDLPVAFLNLSNGAVKSLESWHWVTLIGLTPTTGRAQIYDDGRAHEIDLIRWLHTTALGGGFVALEPAA